MIEVDAGILRGEARLLTVGQSTEIEAPGTLCPYDDRSPDTPEHHLEGCVNCGNAVP
jgi:hypothetical protein